VRTPAASRDGEAGASGYAAPAGRRAIGFRGAQPASCKLGAVSSHEITQLIHQFGLIVVFLAAGLQAMGFPVPGGTALVIAGIDASTKNGLPLAGVIAAGALGALLGGTAGFAAGRWRGEPALLRIGRLFGQQPERVQELRGQFETHAIAPLFIARFITGLRNVAGLLAGASGVGFGRFLAVSAIAALAWSALITLEYYFAGHAILAAPTWLQIVLIILGLVATIASFRFLRPGLGARGRRPAEATEASD
jgi:membrane protein DedA with SNARE-associated domain